MSNIQLDLTGGLSEDTIIWKYFNFPSFVSLLLEKALLFRRFDEFSDKLEGTMPKSAQSDFLEYLNKVSDFKDAEKRVKGEVSLIERYKKWAYANSWSISRLDNYALWKIYLSGHNEGIAIRTTIKRLRDSLIYDPNVIKNSVPIHIKKVSYEGFKYVETTQLNTYTNKYPAYEYESELRVLFYNQRNLKDRTTGIQNGYNDAPVKFVGVDLNTLLESVYISPFTQDWFKEMVNKLLKQKFQDIKTTLKSSEIRDR